MDRPRIDRLTSVRGIAALYVFFFHCLKAVPGFSPDRWFHFLKKGYLGVDFFFLLSGFILSYVYAAAFDDRRGNYRHFLTLRLGRLYPTHLATLAAVAALVAIFGPLKHQDLCTAPSLVSNLLLIQAWGFHGALTWNGPAWSISAEWFAYLMFPVLLMMSRPLSRRSWSALGSAGVVVAVLGAIGAAIYDVQMHGGLLFARDGKGPLDLTVGFGLIRVTGECLAGVLLFRGYSHWRDRGGSPSSWRTAGLALALLGVLQIQWARLVVIQDPLAVLLMALVLVSLALDRGPMARLLEHRGWVYLGDVSYGLYLVQGVWFLAYEALASTGIARPHHLATSTAVVVAILALSLASAGAIFEGIEKPARQWTRQRVARRVLSGAAIQPAL